MFSCGGFIIFCCGGKHVLVPFVCDLSPLDWWIRLPFSSAWWKCWQVGRMFWLLGGWNILDFFLLSRGWTLVLNELRRGAVSFGHPFRFPLFFFAFGGIFGEVPTGTGKGERFFGQGELPHRYYSTSWYVILLFLFFCQVHSFLRKVEIICTPAIMAIL